MNKLKLLGHIFQVEEWVYTAFLPEVSTLLCVIPHCTATITYSPFKLSRYLSYLNTYRVWSRGVCQQDTLVSLCWVAGLLTHPCLCHQGAAEPMGCVL